MNSPFNLLQLTPETIPGRVPYLFAEPDRCKTWGGDYPSVNSASALSWQGQPSTDVNMGRSIPLRAFAPLCRIPGVTLISLQKHHGLDQLAHLPPGMRVKHWGTISIPVPTPSWTPLRSW